MADLLERVRAGGLLRPRAAGRRAALGRPRLRLPARPGGPARRRRSTALHCNYGLRAGGRRRRARTAPRCARGSASPLHVAPAARAGAATCRPGRATSATRRRRGSRRRGTPTSPPATRRPTRSRRCSTGSPARRGGARCSAWPRATAGWCARCSACTREETAAHCAARGLAWREDASNDDLAFARNRVRAAPAAGAARPAPGRRGQRAAHARRSCATRRPCSTRAVDAALAEAGDPPARRGAGGAAAGPARGSRCSGWPTARRAAGRRPWATARAEVLALGEGARARSRRRDARRRPRAARSCSGPAPARPRRAPCRT